MDPKPRILQAVLTSVYSAQCDFQLRLLAVHVAKLAGYIDQTVAEEYDNL